MPQNTGYRSRTRSKRRSRRRQTQKNLAMAKATPQNQKRQIMNLQRQVTSINRKVKDVYQYTKFDQPITVVNLLPPIVRSTEDTEAFNVFPLMEPNSWQEIFSTNETVIQQKECLVTNVNISAWFTPKNSLTPLSQKWVTVWLVSLKKEAAAQTLNQTNNLTTTENDNGLNAQKQGEFYFTRNSNGPFSSMPLLNPKVFKIHQHRRFTIGNIMQDEQGDEDVAVVDYRLSNKRIQMNQRLNTTIATQTGIHGVAETWKDLNQFQVEQTDRLYIITHVGGYAEDGDNGVNFAPHVSFTVRTVR